MTPHHAVKTCREKECEKLSADFPETGLFCFPCSSIRRHVRLRVVAQAAACGAAVLPFPPSVGSDGTHDASAASVKTLTAQGIELDPGRPEAGGGRHRYNPAEGNVCKWTSGEARNQHVRHRTATQPVRDRRTNLPLWCQHRLISLQAAPAIERHERARMSDVVSTTDVGNVLLYLAPGYFAQAAYVARFPQPPRDRFQTLVVSVATSVPLVAVAHGLFKAVGGKNLNATHVVYVLFLLGLSILTGYLVSLLREPNFARGFLAAIGFRYQPERSIYELVLRQNDAVTGAFKDGKRLGGVVALGPGQSDDESAGQLYVVYPAWIDPQTNKAESEGAGAGVIVNLSEVETITVAKDPVFDAPGS